MRAILAVLILVACASMAHATNNASRAFCGQGVQRAQVSVQNYGYVPQQQVRQVQRQVDYVQSYQVQQVQDFVVNEYFNQRGQLVQEFASGRVKVKNVQRQVQFVEAPPVRVVRQVNVVQRRRAVVVAPFFVGVF
jgi:hypothetical protein